MSSSTTTDSLSEMLADYYHSFLDTATMVFGDGGYDNGEVLLPLKSQTALNNQLISRPIISYSKPTVSSVKATGRLLAADLVGESISEAGIIVNGSLMGIRNFEPKIKEDDEVYDVSITLLF